jgi:hypothetical protein
VSNRNETERPPHTRLAMATNDQGDDGDHCNEHLNLRADVTQPDACAVHVGGQISGCQVDYNMACCVITRAASPFSTLT